MKHIIALLIVGFFLTLSPAFGEGEDKQCVVMSKRMREFVEMLWSLKASDRLEIMGAGYAAADALKAQDEEEEINMLGLRVAKPIAEQTVEVTPVFKGNW